MKVLLVGALIINLTTNFWAKSLKEVMECENRLVNHVKAEPRKVVEKVLHKMWFSPM